MAKDVQERRTYQPWQPLRATAVTTSETSGAAAVIANTFHPAGPFVDLYVYGTLSATTTFDLNVMDVEGLTATRMKHAFKDGSSKVTVTTNSVYPMVAAAPHVGVMIDNVVGGAGAVSVQVKIRDI